MKLIDVTVGIEPGMVVWPNDVPVTFEQKSSLKKGDGANVLKLTFSTHTGSHVDAPLHFGFNGTVEKMRLDALIGPAFVVHVKAGNFIRPEHFAHVNFKKYRRILFRTRNSTFIGDGRFHKDYVTISPEAAKELARQKVLLVGVDGMSVDSFRSKPLAHNALLSKNIVLLENINLRKIPAGEYELYCLPLKLSGADGAPARVILGRK